MEGTNSFVFTNYLFITNIFASMSYRFSACFCKIFINNYCKLGVKNLLENQNCMMNIFICVSFQVKKRIIKDLPL